MNYELIKERAEIVFDLIEDKINYGYDMDNPDMLDAYKATFALKSKSISQFKRAFRETSLEFCISSVEAIYETYCLEIPGPSELTWEEKEILRELLDSINKGSSRAFL